MGPYIRNSAIFSASILLFYLMFISVASLGATYQVEKIWPEANPWNFDFIADVALDSKGNMYLLDRDLCKVRKFTATGELVTSWGSRGTGDSRFSLPTGITIDENDFIYVLDNDSELIQKFDSDGKFQNKWAVPDKGGFEYYILTDVASDFNGFIYAFGHSFGYKFVKKFTSTGEYVEEWGLLGRKEVAYDVPVAIDIHKNGYIYVCEHERIQKFTLNGELVAVLGEDEYFFFRGIAVDKDGFVYASEGHSDSRIVKFSPDWQEVAEWQIDSPYKITADAAGFVYVISGDIVQSLHKFDSNGNALDSWGRDSQAAGEFRFPSAIAIDRDGFVFVVDTFNHRIQKFTTDGQFVQKWGRKGYGPGEFDLSKFFPPQEIGGITIGTDGTVYVVDHGSNRIQSFKPNGDYIEEWNSYGVDLAVGGDSNIYTVTYGDMFEIFTPQGGDLLGIVQTKCSTGDYFCKFSAIAVNSKNHIYLIENFYNVVHKYSLYPAEMLVNEWGQRGSEKGQFLEAQGIDVDANDLVYVADTGNHRIQIFGSDGQFLDSFGEFGSEPGFLNRPRGIAVSDDGRIYVCDTDNHRIQVFSLVEPKSVPIVGDWNGDRVSELGFFENGIFNIDTNGDFAIDEQVFYGTSTDIPVVGDCDGDGITDLGVYRESESTFYMDVDRDGITDHRSVYGTKGDIPLAGDWNGDGISDISIYRPSRLSFYLDFNRDGRSEIISRYGAVGDIPVVGDWDGDGTADIGMYRPSKSCFYLDFNEDGRSEIWTVYGTSGDIPLSGDWDGDGLQDTGVFRPSNRTFYLDILSDGKTDYRISLR